MNKETINHYNKLITNVDDMSGNGKRIRFNVGDKFIIEVTKCEHNLKSKNDLMNIWKNCGLIEKKLATHIYIDTYFTDAAGQCWGYYNITHTKNHKINFDYLREWNAENVAELVAECIRLREMAIA